MSVSHTVRGARGGPSRAEPVGACLELERRFRRDRRRSRRGSEPSGAVKKQVEQDVDVADNGNESRCITDASRAQHLAVVRGISGLARNRMVSQDSQLRKRWKEESGLQACYGKSPGNGTFSIRSFRRVLVLVAATPCRGDFLGTARCGRPAVRLAGWASFVSRRGSRVAGGPDRPSLGSVCRSVPSSE